MIGCGRVGVSAAAAAVAAAAAALPASAAEETSWKSAPARTAAAGARAPGAFPAPGASLAPGVFLASPPAARCAPLAPPHVSVAAWEKVKLEAVDGYVPLGSTGIMQKPVFSRATGIRVAEGQIIGLALKVSQGPDWGTLVRYPYVTLRLGDAAATPNIPPGVHAVLLDGMCVGDRRLAVLPRAWHAGVAGDRDYVFVDVAVYGAGERCSRTTARLLGVGLMQRARVLTGFEDVWRTYIDWRRGPPNRVKVGGKTVELHFSEEDYKVAGVEGEDAAGGGDGRPLATPAEQFFGVKVEGEDDDEEGFG